MASFASGAIEAFVGPRELGALDDLEQVVIEFICGAEQSLDIAVQELDSEPIAQAVLDAAGRRISVRMFLEQDYLLAKRPLRPRPRPGETEAQALHRAQWEEERWASNTRSNREILAALLRCRVDVKADYNPAIFHQKFIVRDARGRPTPRTGVLSGSANFTSTDTHRNLNHAVVFHDARIAAEYRGEFEQLRTGEFGRGRHGKVPRGYNVGGIPVRVLFAPDHTPELEIVKQLLKCRERLDFAVFTFAGSSGIDDAMLLLKDSGRSVRGALDPTQGVQAWAATRWLHEGHVELLFPPKSTAFGKLHHKLMVIDEAIVIAGSMNYTAPANEYNDENIFVMGSPYPDLPPADGGPPDVAACAELCRFFRAEIERICSTSLPFEPPPP